MNGIYLYLLLNEIKDKLVNLYIDDIQCMDRIIQIVFGEKSLFVSLYPEAPAIYLSKIIKQGFERLKLFSSELQGSRITKIEQPNFTPVLKLQLDKLEVGEKKNIEVIISLYREAPNFSVKTSFFQKNFFKRYIEKKQKKSILELNEQELKSFFPEKIIKEFEGIDKYLASELIPKNLTKLKKILSGEKFRPRLISISPLRISLFSSEEYIKEYPSLNKLLEDGIKTFLETKSEFLTKSRRNMLIRNLKKCIERLKKKMLTTEEIEKYRVMGEIILTNIAKIKKGMHQVTLVNPYTQKNIEIKLDPRKSPQQNAQTYFSKYKKLKRGQPKIRKKIADIRKQIEDIKEKTLEPYNLLPQTTQKTKKEKPLPFRLFNLPSGSIVYVGKSAKSNTELTFSFARPNDYFFHVRGYEGAHTILKAKVPKGQRPRKEDIESAASIAAYFSKAKKQKNVPVSYTQRKYLKKNKKGKPGSVILMREQVIFIEPHLLDNKELC